jgi:phospholipase C
MVGAPETGESDSGPEAASDRCSFAALAGWSPEPRTLSRRAFIGAGAGLAAGVLGPALSGRALSKALAATPPGVAVDRTSEQWEALQVLGRPALRWPDSRPYPHLPIGTDTMPNIEHIVVLMMENHSYDNFFGMLGRGDGFTLGANGLPTATNPYSDGRLQHAFRMPTTCQFDGQPSNEWKASHLAYNNGAMNGFMTSPIDEYTTEQVGPVTMGYWTGDDLPFTYSLASSFPLADRWFCSLLGQTDPNRRFLIAATSSGMTDDISFSLTPNPNEPLQDALLLTPANGTIFDRLSLAQLTWVDYQQNFPTGTTAADFPVDDVPMLLSKNNQSVTQFFSDCSKGLLPDFCIIEPNYGTQSQENPQNIVVGDAFIDEIVHAIGTGPDWRTTLLILTYDEHGGYYDHVPPPVALAPDDIPPIVAPGESAYDGFRRYGFRVPSMIVSPFAKQNYVSHQVFDHTSVLALVERKWNLPAMTWRDANANDLTDLLDFSALAAHQPTFPELPPLAAAGNTPARLACSVTGPGHIPPAGSISPAP